MLKHVHLSPSRVGSGAGRYSRSDNISITSCHSLSLTSAGQELALSSRSSSYTSLNETHSSAGSSAGSAGSAAVSSAYSASSARSSSVGAAMSVVSARSNTVSTTGSDSDTPSVPVKVFARCLRSDIEYKTLRVTFSTTCKQLVSMLLNKYRMKHRDPNLFYLTMEVCVRNAGNVTRTVLVLDDAAEPAQLQACRPTAESRFILRMREGGLVRIYDGILMQGSHYKSLLVSERTRASELLQIILNCNSCAENSNNFFLLENQAQSTLSDHFSTDTKCRLLEIYQLIKLSDLLPYMVCRTSRCERRLRPDDRPVQLQTSWVNRESYFFVLQKEAPVRRPRKLPWRPNLSSVESQESLSSLQLSPTKSASGNLSAKSASYHDYENYFYI